MRASDDQLAFRAWLVKQLTLTRWSAPLKTPLPELAEHLGVTVSVLEEAQARRAGELKKLGKGGVTRGRRRYIGHDYAEIDIKMPPPVYAEWVGFCKARRIEQGTVLRSLIHHFLLDPKKPSVMGGRWLFRGQSIPAPRTNYLKAKTRLTRGAQTALDTHADNWNVKPTGLARGIITDFLDGKIPRVKMVAFSELWGDADRYLHPEKFQ